MDTFHLDVKQRLGVELNTAVTPDHFSQSQFICLFDGVPFSSKGLIVGEI
jgi:hypothetical protein